MIEAAGGASQVKEFGDEVRIYPKSEKHYRQMQEAYAPALALESEAAGHIGAAWQTERVRMKNGELREVPLGSGLPVVPRIRGRRVSMAEIEAGCAKVRPLRSVADLLDEMYPA